MRRGSNKIDADVAQAEAHESVVTLNENKMHKRLEAIKRQPELTNRIWAIIKFTQYFLLIQMTLTDLSAGMSTSLIMFRQAPFGRGEFATNAAAIPENELKPIGQQAFITNIR